ncbi:hypothetical protein K3495_g16941, partial [Podosphaera aphanis]
ELNHTDNLQEFIDTHRVNQPNQECNQIDLRAEHSQDEDSTAAYEYIAESPDDSDNNTQDHSPAVVEETENTVTGNRELPPPPKKYNTRGANARPSRKQAENEIARGPHASKYGPYPVAYMAQYTAGTKLRMDPPVIRRSHESTRSQ